MQKRLYLLSNSGSTILLAVVFGAVFALMAAGTISLAAHGLTSGERDIDIIKAYWANESALNVGSEIVLIRGSPPAALGPLVTVPGNAVLRLNGFTPNASIVAVGNLAQFAASTGLAGGRIASATTNLQFVFASSSLTGLGWSTVVQ